MRRITVLVACVLAAAALLALAMPAIAGAAYATNAECLACHDQVTGSGAVTKADFSAGGSVDYTKCRACHWIPQATLTHGNFSHNHIIGKVFPSGYKLGGPNCTPCHYANATGTGDLTHVMTTQTVDGWFATANPRLVPAADLHAIHARGSWPKNVLYTKGCASCHEAAACTACHVNPPAAHTDHTKNAISGTYAYPPVAYKIGIGTPVTSPDLATVTTSTVTCVNAACHALAAAGTSGFTPFCGGCHPDNVDEHGYGSIDHVADNGAVVEPGGTTTCAECHSMDLMTEHGKPTSAGARSCATCHPSPRDTFTTWDQGCEQCHVPASPTVKHSGVLAAHALAGDATCVACHDTPLAEIHSIATTTTADGTFSSCLVCHNPASAATLPGKDCVDCHFAWSGHPAPAASHVASASATCATCHDGDPVTPGTDLLAIHASLACATCHDNPSRIEDFSVVTPECSSCHGYAAADGTDHKDFAAKHAVTADSVTCWQYCHGPHHQESTIASDAVHHQTYYPTPVPNCIKCHNDTYDLTGKTSSCNSCHGDGPDLIPTHADYAARHVASTPASAECVACHETGDTAVLHKTPYGCNLCHVTAARGGTAMCTFCHAPHNPMTNTPLKLWAIAECGNQACHGVYGSQVVTSTSSHYGSNTASHTASAEPAYCADCHSMDMRTDHVAVPDACVTCHETKVDYFTTAWDKTCAQCHPTKHAAAAPSHDASSSTACGGPDCHVLGDVTAVHYSAETTTTGGQRLAGCQVCHTNTDLTLTTSECSNCHAGHGDLDALHAATSASGSCSQQTWCHATDVRSIHAASPAGRCAVCHDNPAVDLTGKTADCAGCHDPATYTGDVDGTGHTDYVSLHTPEAESDPCLACHPHEKSLQVWNGTEYVTVVTLVPIYHPYTGLDFGGIGRLEPIDCSLCHNNTTRGPATDLTVGLSDIRCSNCHDGYAVDGSGHAAMTASHETSATDPVNSPCTACHSQSSTAQIHASAEATIGGVYVQGCALCHRRANSRCFGCHALHGGDLTVMVANPANCNNYYCHGGASGRKAVPSLDAHYIAKSAAHQAVAPDASCATCHSLDLRAAHESTTTPGLPVDCAGCHTAKADVLGAGWNGDCSACHPITHATAAAKHTGFASARTTCVGAGCHVSRDLPEIHAPFVGPGKPFQSTCVMCHANPAVGNAIGRTAMCDSCHSYVPDRYGDYHGLHHEATSTFSQGCQTCHGGGETHIDGSHGALADLTKCAICHNNPAKGGDITWNMSSSDCEGCHAAHAITGSISGRVTDALGAGVSGASIATDKGQSTSADAGGYYALADLDADTYSLTVSAGGYADQTRSVVVAVRAAETADFTLAPPAPETGTLSGLVTTGGGAPISGATVTTDKGQSATTGADGTYSFADIALGDYSVTVAADGYVTQTKTGTVTAGASTAVDFMLAVPTGSVGGRVTSSTGAGLAGASVVTDKGQSAVTDGTGAYSFAALPEGSYTITVSMTGYVTKAKAASVTADVETVADFALPPRIPGNLAYGQPFTASNSAGAGYAANLAGDDDPGTFWWSNTKGAANAYETLVVDLGVDMTHRRYEIVWTSSYAKSFTVQVSRNGTSWTQIHVQSAGTGGTYTFTSGAMTARYIRVVCKATSGVATGYGIAEFRVFN